MAKAKENLTENEEKEAKASAVMNTKAEAFNEFLEENQIQVFSKEVLTDDLNTVVFRSRIETKGQIIPMAVIIDDSVFTIIRTQIASGVSIDKKDKLIAFFNMLNEKYKIFKYYLRQDGIVFLDVTLPFVNETFDSKMVQLMLSVLVKHLDETYEDIMSQLWSKEEK